MASSALFQCKHESHPQIWTLQQRLLAVEDTLQRLRLLQPEGTVSDTGLVLCSPVRPVTLLCNVTLQPVHIAALPAINEADAAVAAAEAALQDTKKKLAELCQVKFGFSTIHLNFFLHFLALFMDY